MPTLELDHLTKTYGSGDSVVRALTEIGRASCRERV